MELIIYLIPLLMVVITILVFKQTDRFNKKSILLSLAILIGAIVVKQALYFLMRFVTNAIDDTTAIMIFSILVDVVAQIVILFVESELYLKVFGLERKKPVCVYIVLVCSIIISAVLYYYDYIDMFTALKDGIGGLSFIGMISIGAPKFGLLRRIISLLPAASIIVAFIIDKHKKRLPGDNH